MTKLSSTHTTEHSQYPRSPDTRARAREGAQAAAWAHARLACGYIVRRLSVDSMILYVVKRAIPSFRRLGTRMDGHLRTSAGRTHPDRPERDHRLQSFVT